jgi:murein DD-endopeptidase MepM/ murein hydrolase activator NlpD
MKASGWLLILGLIAAIGLGGFAWYRAEGEPPTLAGPEGELVIGKNGLKLVLSAADVGSGLRSLRVALARSGAAEQVLFDESYPGNLLSGGTRGEQAASVQLDPARLAVKGPGTLSIAVRDWSWRGAFGGNETRRELPLRVDLEPPRIEVTSGISGITYVRQGGSGSVAYRVSEPTARDGVRVGTAEYRGFPRKGGGANERIALFAVPTDVDAKAAVRVFAEDAAGNSSEAGWSVVVQPYVQPEGKVPLPQSFLDQVVPRLSGGTAGEAAFQDVNTRVRAENEKKIREIVANTAPEPLFTGHLHQLANSKVTSRFGEKRVYVVDGREVSRAVHYGYDLASLSGAPVTATAAGRVLYAGELGIYGNCVVLDHGLGLASIYGHLSRIDVEVNANVASDQRLGLTGATGLAGGDHLHFATLVGNTYVDPIEWWDAKWVTDHVAPNLNPQPIAQ